jgi:putative ABC transport system permease protein
MNLPLTLAWRYLSGRKLRTSLTTLAVIFGVLVLFGLNIIIPTIFASVQANFLGLAGAVDYTVTSPSGGSFPEGLADDVKDVDGIRAFSPKLNRTVNLPADFIDKDRTKADVITVVNLVGIVPDSEQSLRSYVIVQGRFLESGDTTAAVISQSLADALGVTVNGSFSLPTVNGIESLTVVGILPPRTQPGNEEVLVTLPQAQHMTGEAGKINAIDIVIAAGVSDQRRSEIMKGIEAAVGKEYRVGAPLNGSDLFANLKLGRVILNLFGILALFMGGFIIFNTFRTAVVERRRDIGMLRALGANRNTVLGIILMESLLQGLMGTAAGLVLGYLLGAGVIRISAPVISSYMNLKLGNPVVSPGLIVGSLLLGLGVPILAGLLPAWNASRVTPLEALRPSVAEVDVRRRLGVGSISGIAIVALSALGLVSGNSSLMNIGGFLFLVGLVLIAPLLVRPVASAFGKILGWAYARRGIGDLACGNLTRQPSRAAVTASSTMLGLAVIVAAGGLVGSMTGSMFELLHKNLGSDYLFVPLSVQVWQTNVGADPEFADRLRSVPGIADVGTLRFAVAQTGHATVQLMGIDPVEFPKVSGLVFMQGGDSAYQELAEGRNLIANGAFLSGSGVAVGQAVSLLAVSGSQTYRVIALAADFTNSGSPTAYISQANMQADFGVDSDIFLQLNLKPDADRAAAEAQIKAIAADFPQFNLISGASYFETLKTEMNGVIAGFYLLFGFLAFPSLIAMLNTLAIGVIERTREIGIIRAVGATRGQIGAMVTAEALLLAAVGTLFGLAAGSYLGYAFIYAMRFIFPVSYRFPALWIAVAAGFGMLAGALAAVIPARQASRMDIIRALRYE